MAFTTHKAYASELTNRSIQLSSSQAGATGVTYTVTFTTATTGVIQGVVINFCDDTPLIGTNCQYTNPGTLQSINVGSAVLSTVTGTHDNTVGASDWKIDTTDTNTNTANDGVLLNVTNANVANTSIAASTAITFTFTTITNPNYTSNAVCATALQPNCSFYARILTYSVKATANAYISATPGAFVDSGGIAMSTAAQITVTAKVQEILAFCVWSNLGTAQACGASSTTPSVALGNTNGVLSSSNSYANIDTSYSVQTNASSGAAVMVKGSTLTNGAFTIAALTTGSTSTRGTAQFGMCSYESSGTTLAIAANYNGGAVAGHLCSNVADGAGATSGTSGSGVGDAGATFYFGTTAVQPGGAVNGEQMATDSAGTTAQGQVAFMANIPITQAPGIYTANIGLIANGTY
jgi:hypothetical protein